ncbi:MAG: hypothetical protein HUU01_22030 [Saprospiraceae bacterium]|nr:hypothetical protein [Saprospiraceae bacterium]
MPEFNYKPLVAVASATILIVLITIVLPSFFKTWFVYETGNFRMLPAIGPILAFGLLARWRVRKIAIGFFAIGLCFSLVAFFGADASFYPGYALLVALQVLLLWVLMGDGLKGYLDGGELKEQEQMSEYGR